MGEVTDLLNKAKAWWKSKTIIGSIIQYVPTLLLIFGIDLNLAGIEATIFELAEGIAYSADQIIVIVVATWGFIQAIYGRFKANRPIEGFKISIPGGGLKKPSDK